MESCEAILGEGRSLEMQFDSRDGQIEAESWFATLRQREFDDDGEETASEVLASASLVRLNLVLEDWFDSLDAESGDLAEVGAALNDQSRLSDVDEESVFADSLLIVNFISVAEKHRGARLSHSFVRGIANIFRNELIALIPAGLSSDSAGNLVDDDAKRRGLRRHWKRAGFVRIPGTEVMILPFVNR